jgi:hypothetical protein
VPDVDLDDLLEIKTLDEVELEILSKKVELLKARLIKLEETK